MGNREGTRMLGRHEFYRLRPFSVPWTGLPTPAENRRGAHLFKASWEQTLDLLQIELNHLTAERCVIEIDVQPEQLRIDGGLRAGVQPWFPGVRVSFETTFGEAMQFATDMYDRQTTQGMSGWRANVRAVALTLGALRDIDRWGVAHRGEQYRGFTAVASVPHQMSADEAAEFIAHWAGDPRFTKANVLADPAVADRAMKVAGAKTHPDRTNDPDTFRRLTEARGILRRTQRS